MHWNHAEREMYIIGRTDRKTKTPTPVCQEILKLNFRNYPAIHTNYITPQSTTL